MVLTRICTLILLLASLCSLNGRCKKDPPEAVLPPVTNTGNNTIGFVIDGKVWVPYYKCGLGKDPCGEYLADYGQPLAPRSGISFQFERERGNVSSSLTITSSFGTITTAGDKIDSLSAAFMDEGSNGNSKRYFGPLIGSHFNVTKVDTVSKIISGTFELILLEQNGSGKTITLKNGRFDFRFNACKCTF